MVEELSRIENLILKLNRQKITNQVVDQECEEYLGLNFNIDQLSIKFRKAKITPKKTGQFVTLWKRDSEDQTTPFNVNDNFDFYIIAAKQGNNFGFFLFPKSVLSQNKILTNGKSEGKRGFRIYPDWTKPGSKQAEKTKSWQTKYFIDLTNNESKSVEKFNFILSDNSIPVRASKEIISNRLF